MNQLIIAVVLVVALVVYSYASSKKDEKI